MNKAFLSFAVVCLISCGLENKSDKKTNIAPPAKPSTYTLTPFAPSESFPDAKLSNMQYKDGNFDFTVSGDSYQLGQQTEDASSKRCANSGKGQHIHLIVNKDPYAAKYESNFDYELPDGNHHILAFLSRSYHESIKQKGASIAVIANIKDKTIVSSSPIKEPTLFYSRPKGTYVGKDTEKVMLDFYLANVELGEGYTVTATINGEDYSIDKWQPYYISDLPYGENTIKLSLLDADGNLVDSPLNPVSRTFTLKEDPGVAM